ncbi:MAG: M28 family peptidase, partial [Alphaproteobacteria bacterium]|nr:M28 family peptidase [Alphaproteobacteria bacterium]
GHLQSEPIGTGATDNAAGSATSMEVARIFQALGIRPRRTIRIGLWGGLVGAYYGLHLGFSANEGAEGMLVGAIIGAGAGIGVGAYESVSEFNDGVSECLRVKGYTVS